MVMAPVGVFTEMPVPPAAAEVTPAFVRVTEPPSDTAPPPLRPVPADTVTELFVNLLLAIEPANIAFVTVPESPVVITVPVVAGRVMTTPEPAAAVALRFSCPLVDPEKFAPPPPIKGVVRPRFVFAAVVIDAVYVPAANSANVTDAVPVTSPVRATVTTGEGLPVIPNQAGV